MPLGNITDLYTFFTEYLKYIKCLISFHKSQDMHFKSYPSLFVYFSLLQLFFFKTETLAGWQKAAISVSNHFFSVSAPEFSLLICNWNGLNSTVGFFFKLSILEEKG